MVPLDRGLSIEIGNVDSPIAERIEQVRLVRQASSGNQSQGKAQTPHRFVYCPHKESNALIVPSITTDSRYYLPVGIVKSDTVISNKAAVIYNPPLWTLSIVASRLHEQWIGNVCVRMRMGYSYSNTRLEHISRTHFNRQDESRSDPLR